MNARVIFRWEDERNGHVQGQGTTRDVSVKGAFVLSAACPPTASKVYVEIALRGPGAKSGISLKSEMNVLRVEPDITGQGQRGFCAVCKGFSLRPISALSPKFSGASANNTGWLFEEGEK